MSQHPNLVCNIILPCMAEWGVLQESWETWSQIESVTRTRKSLVISILTYKLNWKPYLQTVVLILSFHAEERNDDVVEEKLRVVSWKWACLLSKCLCSELETFCSKDLWLDNNCHSEWWYRYNTPTRLGLAIGNRCGHSLVIAPIISVILPTVTNRCPYTDMKIHCLRACQELNHYKDIERGSTLL